MDQVTAIGLQLNQERGFMSSYVLRAIKFVWYTLTHPDVVVIEGVKINIQHDQITDEVRRHFYTGSYEGDEIRVVKDLINKNDIVVEVGAGIGFVSAYVAMKIGSDRVYAFEANPFMIEKIQENYVLNNVAPHISNLFLAKEEGKRDFFIDKNFWSSSSIQRKERSTTRIEVETVDVNQVLNKINPTVLIMDIEGGEEELIPLINFKDSSINKIMIELHPGIIGKRNASVLLARMISDGFNLNFFYSRNNVLFLER